MKIVAGLGCRRQAGPNFSRTIRVPDIAFRAQRIQARMRSPVFRGR